MLDVLKEFPEVKHTYATIGARETSTVRDGEIYVKLVERKNRGRNQEMIQRDLRARMEEIPGILPAILEWAGGSSEKPLVVNIRGEDITLLKKYSAVMKTKIYQIPGVVDLEVTLEQDIPEFRLTVDREKAMDAGVMTVDIVRTVGALVGGQAVSTYEDEDGDAVNVRVRLPQDLRQDLRKRISSPTLQSFSISRGPCRRKKRRSSRSPAADPRVSSL